MRLIGIEEALDVDFIGKGFVEYRAIVAFTLPWLGSRALALGHDSAGRSEWRGIGHFIMKESSFARRLRYGELVIDDVVHLSPLQEVRYEVPAQGEIPASRMTMTIEAPSEGVLWVRFLYDDGNVSATDEMGKMYEDFKKSAYQEADIDTIKIVRQLASEGKLDSTYLN